jgi:hypothetical protein
MQTAAELARLWHSVSQQQVGPQTYGQTDRVTLTPTDLTQVHASRTLRDGPLRAIIRLGFKGHANHLLSVRASTGLRCREHVARRVYWGAV